MNKPRVLIVSPALANANNGNWQTAWRWSRMLSPQFDATIAQTWDGAPGDVIYDVMLALHARRSADAIAAWAKAKGATAPSTATARANTPGLAVVLTGTDLYRDIQTDAAAQSSLRYAHQLVVLQECGTEALPSELRGKTQVIFQSTSTRKTLQKPKRHLRALMVGHLRDEKSPQTLFAAAKLMAARSDILIDHIGEPLDAALGTEARAIAANCSHYRWLGGLPHRDTRRRIQQAHVLVHASSMEGGAHVVMEAVCSGTPVLASRIAGNVGMLGADYPGYFEHGNEQALAGLLVRCRTEQTETGLYAQLQSHCAARAHLFDPKAEQAALIKLVRKLLPKSA